MSAREPSEPLYRRLAPPLALVALMTGFAGWFVGPSYDDVRPRSDPDAWSPAGPQGLVPSLPTDDPLAVAQRARIDAHENWEPIGAKAAAAERKSQLERARRLFEQADGNTLFLVVWQPGGSWREDRERRRRDRHALVSAMASADFVLQGRRQTVAVDFGADADDADSGPLVAAFDAFDRKQRDRAEDKVNSREQKYSRVVVMWLDAEQLGATPMRRVLKLQGDLLPAYPFEIPGSEDSLNCAAVWPRAGVTVIHVGPSGSNQLGTILSELGTAGDTTEHLCFHSPFATEPAKRKKIASPPSNRVNLEFHEKIGTDDTIAELLVGELFQRLPRLDDALCSGLPSSGDVDAPLILRALHWFDGQQSGSPSHTEPLVRRSCDGHDARAHVAIIAEQDSAYGRHWKETMRVAVTRLQKHKEHFSFQNEYDPAQPELDFPIRFQLVPYIGVIDGDQQRAGGGLRDYPFGPSQIDYLQRLERDLSGERFDAVGIFGSDVSDTLAILQAMRPRFPGVLFFTIDLDARFLHSSHLPYTRNLVIASHFGLDDLGTTRHFRDVYEHSLFRAVAPLVGVPRSLQCKCDVSPKLFEIGRNQAIQLNAPWIASAQASSGTPVSADAASHERLRSERDTPTASYVQFANALSKSLSGATAHANSTQAIDPLPNPDIKETQARNILVVLTILWLLGFEVVRRTSKRAQLHLTTWSRRFAVRALFPVGVLFSALLLEQLQLAARLSVMEPLFFSQGVSAWVPMGLLLASSMLGLLGLWRIRSELRALGDAMHKRSATVTQPLGWSKELRQSFSLLRTFKNRVRLARLVLALGVSSRMRWILLRATVFSVFVWWSTNIIADFDHSAMAERGLLATKLHEWSERIALVVFVALVYAVVEATIVCIRFAAQIVRDDRVEFGPVARTVDAADALPSALVRIEERYRVAGETLGLAERLPHWPAGVVCVFVAARAPLFDAWMWSNSAVAVLIGAFIAIAVCMWRVRRTRTLVRSRHEQDLESLAVKWRSLAQPLADRRRVVRALVDLRRGPTPSLARTPGVGTVLGPAVTYAVSLLSDPSILQWAASLGGVPS